MTMLCITLAWTGNLIIFLMPKTNLANGVHISRPLRRLVGSRGRVLRCLMLLPTTGAVLVLVDASLWIVLGLIIADLAWLVDDWLTGGRDDDPKRKHHPFRVKLRMPKPVKLRPVERAPVPA